MSAFARTGRSGSNVLLGCAGETPVSTHLRVEFLLLGHHSCLECQLGASSALAHLGWGEKTDTVTRADPDTPALHSGQQGQSTIQRAAFTRPSTPRLNNTHLHGSRAHGA